MPRRPIIAELLALALLSAPLATRPASAAAKGPGGTAVARPEVVRPAAPPNYTSEEVTVITGDRQRLAGTLTLPGSARRPLAAVVLISGTGAQDRDMSEGGPYRPFRQIADALSRSGIAVLRLDDRGAGKSTGSLDSSTTGERAADTRAALAFLRARSDVDGRRLGLIGMSEGALIAAMIAADDTTLRGIVLLSSPGESGREIVSKQSRRLVREDPTIRPAQRDSVYARMMGTWSERIARDRWTRFFSQYSPQSTAMRVRTPVLIVQGTIDRNVPPDDAHLLESAFHKGGNRDVTVAPLEGRNHALLYEIAGAKGQPARAPSPLLGDDVIGLITEWTRRHLR